MAEQNVKSIWVSGSSLLAKKSLAPELAMVLERLKVTAKIANVKEGMVNLRGEEEIIIGLSDIAKAQVSTSFWLVGRHLLNGGQSPNSQIRAILLLLGIEEFAVINHVFQTPMLQLKGRNDETQKIIKGLGLIAKSNFIC